MNGVPHQQKKGRKSLKGEATPAKEREKKPTRNSSRVCAHTLTAVPMTMAPTPSPVSLLITFFSTPSKRRSRTEQQLDDDERKTGAMNE